MRNKLILILIAIVLLMGGALWFMGARLSSLNDEIDRKTQNIKALEDSNVEMVYKMSELKASKDSLNKELMKTIEDLNIKPKKVTEVVYLEKEVFKTDTLKLNDTIFVEGLNIDTTIIDEWSKVNIKMKYPDILSTTFSTTSDNTIVFYKKRETVNPPRKFFLFRWFQKKHTIIEAEVVEKNPYIETKKQRFITIDD